MEAEGCSFWMSLKVYGREDGLGEREENSWGIKGLVPIFLVNLSQGKSLNCFVVASAAQSMRFLPAAHKFRARLAKGRKITIFCPKTPTG